MRKAQQHQGFDSASEIGPVTHSDLQFRAGKQLPFAKFIGFDGTTVSDFRAAFSFEGGVDLGMLKYDEQSDNFCISISDCDLVAFQAAAMTTMKVLPWR